MHNCMLSYARLALVALILAANGDCYAFPPNPNKQGGVSSRSRGAKVPFAGRGNPLIFHRNRRSSDLSASPDNNAQRKQQQTPRRRQHPNAPLRQSSVPVEYDPALWKQEDKSNAASIVRVVNSGWSAVSNKFAVLTPSARRIRYRLSSTLNNNVNSNGATRSTAITEAPVSTQKSTTTTTAKTSTKVKDKISKLDVAIFVTYFCNIAVVTLSVVTVPAMAIEYNLTPHATAAFCAGVASLAPLGGVVGKLVNGFVCQHLGGQTSSWIYLLALSALSLAMSFSRSLAPVGLCLIGFEFLSSIQWTSACAVLDQHYRQTPRKMARGIALLSVSSTVGALAAKTIGAGLLQATEWRTVCRFGSVAALVGAAAMYGGVQQPETSRSRNNALDVAPSVTGGRQQSQSPLVTLKLILSSPIFWMFGIGHSLGYLARGSDRLLGPFLQEIGGISSTVAAGLTSSVTLGFVVGLLQGTVFSKMESVKAKMNMIKQSYVVSVLSTLGLALCGVKGISKLVGGNSNLVVAAITIFSGIIASTVSFQFYQFPNLLSSTIFPENSAVALSLTDAVGFFVTAGVLGVNSRLLGNFGWSTSWAFMAAIFAVGGAIMTRSIQPVLIQAKKNQRRL